MKTVHIILFVVFFQPVVTAMEEVKQFIPEGLYLGMSMESFLQSRTDAKKNLVSPEQGKHNFEYVEIDVKDSIKYNYRYCFVDQALSAIVCEIKSVNDDLKSLISSDLDRNYTNTEKLDILRLDNNDEVIYKELNTWKSESPNFLLCSVIDSDELSLVYLDTDKIAISKLFLFKTEEARILRLLEKTKRNKNRYSKAGVKIEKNVRIGSREKSLNSLFSFPISIPPIFIS